MKDPETVAPELSLVLPAHDEAGHLELVVREFSDALESIGTSFEIIVVDDGSTDDTWETLRRMSRQESRLRGLRLSRNFGKESAMAAGLAEARGSAVIVADTDLQHPPELVPELVERWREGYLLVDGVRRASKLASPLYRLSRRFFYWLYSALCGVDLERHSDYKLLDRQVVEGLKSMNERALFFRGMSQWVGYRRVEVEFDVAERAGGKTRWTLAGLIKLALTTVTSFSSIPLRLVSVTGSVFLVLAVILGLQTLYGWLGGASATGFTTVILLVLISSSLIMIALGIIGEYLAKVYEEVKARPRYLIAERSGDPRERAGRRPERG